jgi:hypothetical protein
MVLQHLYIVFEIYNKWIVLFVTSIVSTPPMICKFGGFRDVSSAYNTDDMQRVGVLCTPFDLNYHGGQSL